MAKITVSRRFHTSVLVGTLLAGALALPAAARADGGVLLNGYAPPGAGEQAILGAGGPTAGAPGSSAKLETERVKGTLPLAVPATATTTQTASAAGNRAHASRKVAAKATRQGASPAAVEAAAAPSAVVTAADKSPGAIVNGWEALLLAGLALIAVALARVWTRQTRRGRSG